MLRIIPPKSSPSMPCYVFLGDDFRLPNLDSLTQSRNGVFGLASGDVNDGFFFDLWWIDMDSDFWWILGDGWRFFLWILGEESATVLGGTSGVETNPSNFVGSRCAYTKLVSTKTHCRFMKYHSHRPWPWRTRCRLTLHCQRCGSTGFAAWVCPRENPRPDVFADRGSQHPTCFYRSIFPMGHG